MASKDVTNQKFIIFKDRVATYRDFTMNLLYTINKYYLDQKTLSNNTDIYNHYSWCFDRVCGEFLKEGIDFKTNKELREYYYGYYYTQYYTAKNIGSLSYYEKFWKNIFDVNKEKNNNNFTNILVEAYAIFDKSINKKI